MIKTLYSAFSILNKIIYRIFVYIHKTYIICIGHEKYIFDKFNRVIVNNCCYTIFYFWWMLPMDHGHTIVFTSTRAPNRRAKGENPLYRTIWYLTVRQTLDAFYCVCGYLLHWESADGQVRLRERQRGAYKQTVGVRKIVSRKAIGRPCRVSIGCHVSQYQLKKKTQHARLCRSTSEWVKFDVR